MYLLIWGKMTRTTIQSTTKAGANQARWGEDVSKRYVGEDRSERRMDAIAVVESRGVIAEYRS